MFTICTIEGLLFFFVKRRRSNKRRKNKTGFKEQKIYMSPVRKKIKIHQELTFKPWLE